MTTWGRAITGDAAGGAAIAGLGQSLTGLDGAAAGLLFQRAFKKGLFAAVSADGTIRVVEAELMRLVGAVLNCPLPPLLETVDPATLAA